MLIGTRRALIKAVSKSSNVTTAKLIADLGNNIVGIWDADLGITKTGSSVTAWQDQSSNAYVLGLNPSGTLTVGTSPTWGSTSYNGKAGLTFVAASRNYLATPNNAIFLISTTTSWFTAAQFDTSSANFGRLLSFMVGDVAQADYIEANSGAMIIRDASNAGISWYQQGSEGPVATVSYNTPTRMGTVFDGTNGTIYVNNVQGAQQTYSFTCGDAAGGFLVLMNAGIANGLGDSLTDGVVRRVLVTKTAVSSSDRANIDSWLQG
jgi:hypothetical protein